MLTDRTGALFPRWFEPSLPQITHHNHIPRKHIHDHVHDVVSRAAEDQQLLELVCCQLYHDVFMSTQRRKLCSWLTTQIHRLV